MSLFNSQYTLGELMNIDGTRQQKAGMCNVTLEKTFHEIKKESLLDKIKSFFFGKNTVTAYYVIFKFNVISDSGKSHTVFIRTNPDFNLNDYTGNKVKIYCNCADFKYRSAYSLNKRNSLFITDRVRAELGPALMEPPRKQATTLLCKHAFAAVQWLIQNYPNVMRTI